MAVAVVRDGHLKTLVPHRCPVCGRMTCRLDPDAVKAGKMVEIKCKCGAFDYLVGDST